MTAIARLLATPTEPFPALTPANAAAPVAVGGDLSPHRLVQAYSRGIFPWFGPDEPILWWSPDPRCVLYPHRFEASRDLRRQLRKHDYAFKLDTDFAQVIGKCAEPRQPDSGTWITAGMQAAYIRLHHIGIAHCAEIWRDGRLVGGLYGLAIGGIFYGESMFSRVSNGSKMALALLIEQLRQWQFTLIDCQVSSAHLLRLGAQQISRQKFTEHLESGVRQAGKPGPWNTDTM